MPDESDQTEKMSGYVDSMVRQLYIHSSLKKSIEDNIEGTLYRKKLLEDLYDLNKKLRKNNTICLFTQCIVFILTIFLVLAIISSINFTIDVQTDDLSAFAFDDKKSMLFAGWTTLFTVFYFGLRPVIEAFIFTVKQHRTLTAQRIKTKTALDTEIMQLEHFLYECVGDFTNNSVDIREQIKDKIQQIIQFSKENNCHLDGEQKKGLIGILKDLNGFLKQDIFTVDINTLAQMSFHKVEEDFSLVFDKAHQNRIIRNSFTVNKEVAAYTKLIEKILSVKN